MEPIERREHLMRVGSRWRLHDPYMADGISDEDGEDGDLDR